MSNDVFDDRKLSVVSAREEYPDAAGEGFSTGAVVRISKISSTIAIFVSGLALFSDGYNAQISESGTLCVDVGSGLCSAN